MSSSNCYYIKSHNKYENVSNYCTKYKSENDILKTKLIEKKNKINNQKNWDIAKKYANEFEFIFSFNNDGVSKIVPISRSYFKMIEIVLDHKIIFHKSEIQIACICEGPGGFIQALNDLCIQHNVYVYPIDCITLISDDKKIPSWKLHNVNNYKVHKGADGTGNIYDIKNIEHFVQNVGKNTCYIVTADGGFDFSKDFNSQEKDFLLLLLCEIYICLNIQHEGGYFIVKVFDLFDDKTIYLLSLLRMFYTEIILQKPRTSRPANSEKYIICKDFQNKHDSVMSYLRTCIINKNTNIMNIIPEKLYTNTYRHVLAYNKKFVHKQIFYIEKTLNLVKSNRFVKNNNIELCKNWCKKYNIAIKDEYML